MSIRFRFERAWNADGFNFWIMHFDELTRKYAISKPVEFEVVQNGCKLPQPACLVPGNTLDEFIDSLELSGITQRYKDRFKLDITSKDKHIEDLRKISFDLLGKL